MIDDTAIGFHSASAGARIRALVLVTRFILRTLRVDHAFRLAVWWRTDKRLLTRADGLIVHRTAQAVRSAGRRRARVSDGGLGIHLRLERATGKRISDVTRFASARGNVIDHRALRPDTAYARTWIFALVANASLVRRAIRAEDALRLTAFVRIAVIVVDAYASPCVIPLLADRVGPARRRLARIYRFLCRKKYPVFN